MSSPNLSVALIVKNEEKNLPKLFKSLQLIRDRMSVEVVVVDTGSEDQTIPICKENGAEVYSFDWIDDFSAARNESLNHCTGDWIFWLDADDVLPENTSFWFVQYLPQLSKNRIYTFTVKSPEGNKEGSQFDQIRLTPNHLGIKFTNPIHESMAASINELNLTATQTRQVIKHLGYSDPDEMEKKKKRNLVLLEKLKARGNIPHSLHFSLARTYQVDSQYEKSLLCFLEIINDSNPEGVHSDIHLASILYAGQCFSFLNKVIEAKAWFEKYLKLGKDHPQYLFEYGKVLFVLNDHVKAHKFFTKALGLSPLDWTIPTDWESIFGGINELLGLIKLPTDEATVPDEIHVESMAIAPEARDISQKESLVDKNARINKEAGWTNSGELEKVESTNSSIAGQDGLTTDLNDMFGKINEPLKIEYPKDTLTVAMIVKNEKENIKAAVDSFLPFADEIIINDTGSSDGTQEILNVLPVKWFQSEWKNDFSLARNQSIDKATSSWILWMDADDRVPEDQIENFKKLKTGILDRVFGFQVINTQAGLAVGARFMQIRMFPNHPSIKFERKIHEQMVFSAARLGLHCIYTETTIHHTGYESADTKKAKARRNLEMSKDDNHLNGVDPTYTMSLGDSYFILEEWEKGIEQYKLTYSIPNLDRKNKDVYGVLPCYIGMGYEKLQNYPEAIKWLDESLEMIPEKLEPHYYKAVCLKAEGKKEEAAEIFEKIIEMPLVHSSTGNQYDVIKIYSYHNLSEYFIESNENRKAIDLIGKMHEQYSQVAESWISLGLGYLNLSKLEEAATAWKKAVDLNPKASKQVLPKLLDLLKKLGHEKDLEKYGKLINGSTNSVNRNPLPVTLCMIVKNEEDNLDHCLSSVNGLFEEIIIVDTGSSDKTISIIKNHNAKLIEKPWEKDFSKSRNYGLAEASCPWIFWMDADDRIRPEDAEKIRILVNTNEPRKAYSFLVQNSRDDGQTGSVFNQIRLFPNNSNIRFSFPIHEQLMPSLENQNIPVQFTDVKVIHTGYDNEDAARQKQIRNRDMLEVQIKSGKNVTAVTYYTLAHAYLDLGENEKAVDYFLTSVDIAEKNGTNPHIIEIGPAKTATALANLNRFEEAQNVLQVGIEGRENPHPETVLLKAQIEEKLGHSKTAGDWYSKLLGFEEQPTFIPVDYNLLKIKALEYLGKYWYEQGKKELAVDLLKSGIQIKSGQTFNTQSLKEKYQKHGIQF